MPKIVALIPLRGGSKSIPNKNIKIIGGKPLCAWVIEAASKVSEVNEIWISTDSSKIATVVSNLKYKVKILQRPSILATDTASTEDVMLHFAKHVDFDILILLQATSPLTTSIDIRNGIKKFLDEKANSLVTVSRIKRFFWSEEAQPLNYNPKNRPRRQDFKGILMENGAFYIVDRETLLTEKCRLGGKIILYEMPTYSMFELDEPEDFKIVEYFLLQNRDTFLIEKVKKIRLLAMDVDGVLTDAGMYYSGKGEELKKFNTRDGKGIELLHKIGVETAIITSEDTKIVKQRAKKLKIKEVYVGVENKLKIIQKLSIKYSISLEEIAFIGDDINDLEALKNVGLSVTVADALDNIKGICDYVCKSRGGRGAVREIAELIYKINSQK